MSVRLKWMKQVANDSSSVITLRIGKIGVSESLYFVRGQTSHYILIGNIVKGYPAQPIDPQSPPLTANLNNTGAYSYDHSRAERVLGIQFRDREITAKDIIDDLRTRGWY